MLKPAIDELLITFDAVFTYFVSIGKEDGPQQIACLGLLSMELQKTMKSKSA